MERAITSISTSDKSRRCVWLFICTALFGPASFAEEIWRGDFETGDTSQYTSITNPDDGNVNYMSIVDEPTVQGQNSCRILLDEDATFPNGLKRVELSYSPAAEVTAEGETTYFAWSFYVPETISSDTETTIGYWESHISYQQIMQIVLIGDDLRIATQRPGWEQRYYGTDVITPGTWHRIAMRVAWHAQPTDDVFDVWLDGMQIVSNVNASTLDGDRANFVQFGLLRGAEPFTDAPVIIVDDAVMGTTLEDVRIDDFLPSVDAGVVGEDAGPGDGAHDAGPGEGTADGGISDVGTIDGGSGLGDDHDAGTPQVSDEPDSGPIVDEDPAMNDDGVDGDDSDIGDPPIGEPLNDELTCACIAARNRLDLRSMGILFSVAVFFSRRRRNGMSFFAKHKKR